MLRRLFPLRRLYRLRALKDLPTSRRRLPGERRTVLAVNPHLADLSNTLLVVAILAYTLAMFGYAIEYAFGRRGAVANRAASHERSRVLVGAGGPPTTVPATP